MPDGVPPKSQNPSTTALGIKVRVNGNWINALVDTGSSITIINENFLNKLQHKKVYGTTQRSYKTANNGDLKTKGLVDLNVKINHLTTKTTAEISSMVCTDLILGKDWCYENDVVINFQEETVKISRNVNNYVQQTEVQFNACHKRDNPVVTISANRECYTCETAFKSRNQLTQHLIEEDHGIQSPLNTRQADIFSKLEHLENEIQQRQTVFMLNKYQELFDVSKPSTINTSIHHTIQTGNHFPIYHHPRRTSNQIREIIQQETKKMLEEGIIRPSVSPWSSPVVIVRKKDGTPRFCIDYRKINNITQKDVYPLPRIEDIVDQLSGSTWFTKFDLKNGYFQVPILEEDKKKTAFATQDGLYEFNRLPQGLINSPPTFQRIMNETLGNLRWHVCLVYLDDIVVYSESFTQHLRDVEAVCTALSKSNFKLNVSKCEIFKQEITFLGYKIGNQSVSPSDDHIQAIRNFPTPKSAKHAYSFAQSANYFRKFIRNFAEIAAPLTKFNRKEVQFEWRSEEQDAFNTLKNQLTSPPVLHLPNRTSTFKIQTDASDIGIGGVLLQSTEDGDKPIGYASRLLSKSEKKYPTIEKEALALWWCITQKFNTYLQGQKFIVETDHRPLIWINKQAYNNARVDRWGIALQEYNYEIKHISGKKNQVADCLSRYPLEGTPGEEENDPVSPHGQTMAVTTRATAKKAVDGKSQTDECHIETSAEEVNNWNKNPIGFIDDDILREHQQRDPEIQNILKIKAKSSTFTLEENGILYAKKIRKNGRKYLLRYVPRSLVRNILLIYHDSTYNGAHFGVKKTFYKIRDRYFWPNQFRDIQDHVSSCIKCKTNNHLRRKPDGHLQPITPPLGIMEKVSMDFVGKIPKSSKGNQYIIVLTDLLSKFVIAKAVSDCTSTTAVKFLVEEVMLKFGIPKEIVTDNGTHFTSSLFDSLTQMMGCCHIKITPYHPQANGQCERYNATFLPKLLTLTNEKNSNWDEKLIPTTFNYNNTKHATTQFTPFELMFARECRLPADPLMEITLPTAHQYEADMRKYIQFAKEIARTNVKENQVEMKKRYDHNRRNPEYGIGDKVLIFNQHPVNKLSPKYIGPYTIIERLGSKTYRVQFEATASTYNVTVDNMQLIDKIVQ